MNYLTNYYKNLSEQLQERINILEKSILLENSKLENSKLAKFEIMHVSAPLAYEAPHLFGLKDSDPNHIAIQGRVINPDGSAGPEVIAPVHAFPGIDPQTMIQHADEMIKRKPISKDNILHATWLNQGGDSPSTLQVDTSRLESLESYSKRIKEHEALLDEPEAGQPFRNEGAWDPKLRR